MKRALVCGVGGFIGGHPSAALRRGPSSSSGGTSGQGSGQRLEGPVNPSARLRAGLGSDERVTVADLVRTVIEVSGKRLNGKYVPGPVGVHARNPSARSGHRFSKARIRSLGWEARVSLKEGIGLTYPWIEAQVEKLRIANCGLRI